MRWDISIRDRSQNVVKTIFQNIHQHIRIRHAPYSISSFEILRITSEILIVYFMLACRSYFVVIKLEPFSTFLGFKESHIMATMDVAHMNEHSMKCTLVCAAKGEQRNTRVECNAGASTVHRLIQETLVNQFRRDIRDDH